MPNTERSVIGVRPSAAPKFSIQCNKLFAIFLNNLKFIFQIGR